jgi:lysozyme
MADVSSNNERYNATEYRAAGHTRTAIKATEGTDYVNPFLRDWADRTHALGMAVSFYHFCRPHIFGSAVEGNHFWRQVKPLWLPGDALHLDLEVGLQEFGPVELAVYHNRLDNYLHGVSGHGSLTYTNLNYYQTLGERLDSHYNEYWIAAYGPKEPELSKGHKLWGWQFTDGTQGPAPHEAEGVGACDLTRVNLRTVLADWSRLDRTRRRYQRKLT